MTAEYVRRIRQVTDQILAAPEPFAPSVISEICSVSLQEKARAGVPSREYEGRFADGPFSTLSYREPRTPDDQANRVIVLELDADVQLRPTDLVGCFDLSLDTVDINARIPPGGMVSLRQEHGTRTLFLQFDGQLWSLRAVVLHGH